MIDMLVEVRIPVSFLTNEMMSVLDSTQSTDGVLVGINALEFLAKLYYPGVTNYLVENYDSFLNWIYLDENTRRRYSTNKEPFFRFWI